MAYLLHLSQRVDVIQSQKALRQLKVAQHLPSQVSINRPKIQFLDLIIMLDLKMISYIK